MSQKSMTFLMIVFALFAIQGEPVKADRAGIAPSAGGTTAASGTIVEDSDATWIWSGMTAIKDAAFHGGTAHAGGPDTYGAFAFEGTSVKIMGYAGPWIMVDGKKQLIGKAKITVDGEDIATATMVSNDDDYGATIYKVHGLKAGSHVVKVGAVGGWVVVDYLVVEKDATAAGKDYYLSPKSAPDKVMETWPGAIGPGTFVDVAAYVSDHGNVWRLTQVGDGLFRVSPAGSPQLALAVLPGHESDSKLGLVTYTGSTGQQWAVSSAGGGLYRLLLAGDRNKCLNIAGERTDNGAPLIIFPWQDDHTNDQWIFTPVK